MFHDDRFTVGVRPRLPRPIIPRVTVPGPAASTHDEWRADPRPLPLSPKESVREAYDKLWQRLERNEKTVLCPVCTRYANLRRQPLNVDLAVFLVRLFRADYDNPGDKTLREIIPGGKRMPKGAKACSDGTTLQYWGLLLKVKRDVYRLLPKGRQWVLGELEPIPDYVITFDARPYIWSSHRITIRQALTTRRVYELKRLLKHIKGNNHGQA